MESSNPSANPEPRFIGTVTNGSAGLDPTLNPPGEKPIDELIDRHQHVMTARLTDVERLAVCQSIAEFGDLGLVLRDINKKFNIKLAMGTLRYYEHHEPWKTVIARFRQKYMEGLINIPIANGRWRMEQLQDIFTNVQAMNGLTKEQKSRVEILLQTLHQAQTEIDPQKRGSLIEKFQQQFNVVFTAGGNQRLGLAGLRTPSNSAGVPPESL